MAAKTAGYSGTPLAKKLGYAENARVLTIDAPENYRALLAPLPPGIRFEPKASQAVDLVHAFVTQKSALLHQLTSLRTSLRPEAAVWVSWPKKSARVPSDITENTVRDVALPLGFVDIKVCAVSDVWSGLKLVVRKELR